MIHTFGSSVFYKESRTILRQKIDFLRQRILMPWKIFFSHQLHFNLTPTSLHFLKFIIRKGEKPGTRRKLYDIIRFGMVLVAGDCGNTGNFYPF